MRKATVIGHLDWNGNNMIGAVVKARNIYKELLNQTCENQVKYVDIYNWRDRKLFTLVNIAKAFMFSKNVVFVCSDTSTLLMRLFATLKRLFHTKIHYCVVGGDIVERLQNYPEQIAVLDIIDEFYVETIDCISGLKALEIKNVNLLRNFKCITPLKKDEISENLYEPYKFCTFSRVIEQKGITQAINAIELINKRENKKICELDIYGPIDRTYTREFENLIKSNDNCNYCGVIDENKSVEILKNYYCLLFPTKYQTEGIPGTIIDGFAAALPVICSDWVRCRQLVTEGVNGIIYPFGDFEGLIQKITYAIYNKEDLLKLKNGALDSFSEYRPEVAIKPLVDKLK